MVRDETDSLQPDSLLPTYQHGEWLTEGGAMKVYLCRVCPYDRGDIAGCYDSAADTQLCLYCPTYHAAEAARYRYELEMRRAQAREQRQEMNW